MSIMSPIPFFLLLLLIQALVIIFQYYRLFWRRVQPSGEPDDAPREQHRPALAGAVSGIAAAVIASVAGILLSGVLTFYVSDDLIFLIGSCLWGVLFLSILARFAITGFKPSATALKETGGSMLFFWLILSMLVQYDDGGITFDLVFVILSLWWIASSLALAIAPRRIITVLRNAFSIIAGFEVGLPVVTIVLTSLFEVTDVGSHLANPDLTSYLLVLVIQAGIVGALLGTSMSLNARNRAKDKGARAGEGGPVSRGCDYTTAHGEVKPDHENGANVRSYLSSVVLLLIISALILSLLKFYSGGYPFPFCGGIEPPLDDRELKCLAMNELRTAGIGFSMSMYVRALDWDTFLFNWENVPGTDEARLRTFLKEEADTPWIKNWVEYAPIEKIDNGEVLRIGSGQYNWIDIRPDKSTGEVSYESNHGTSARLIVKEENGEINIYKEETDDSVIVYSISGPQGNFTFADSGDTRGVWAIDEKNTTLSLNLQYCDLTSTDGAYLDDCIKEALSRYHVQTNVSIEQIFPPKTAEHNIERVYHAKMVSFDNIGVVIDPMTGRVYGIIEFVVPPA